MITSDPRPLKRSPRNDRGVSPQPDREGVRKPRDKAAVESAVNTVNMRVIGYLIEETWTRLSELNDAIEERVFEINHDIRRVDGTTRFERFTGEEAPVLSPLPEEAFEQVEWKEVKAQRNYHLLTELPGGFGHVADGQACWSHSVLDHVRGNRLFPGFGRSACAGGRFADGDRVAVGAVSAGGRGRRHGRCSRGVFRRSAGGLS